ncbi:SH3 domain protein [Aspergillus ibericus CBS 121593]|uniref:SH3 domain-containing protein n=1 Tax=Aspergillus ibericus CBS 121593 TaxID=1448316 RepID=A0A395GT19_9EURO|nr:hypothetical protein BO80DRAFT_152762 [Aspergillus ibericus CBS 121593]RAK98566.1 hypothetical protein BO80DRAFT_152762 [Aspergillus ibericus CBS 121593]
MVHAHAHRDRVARLKGRSPDDSQGVTVVYVTMAPDFDGPIGGYVTGSKTSSDSSKNTVGVGVGAPVKQTRSSSTEEAKTTEASTTHTKAETHTTATTSTETEPTTTRQPTTTEQTTEATKATQVSSTEEEIASSTRTTFQTSTSSSTSSTFSSTSDLSSTTSQSNAGLENAAITGPSSSKASTSASATAVAGSGGLSGGAKAGIAIGVLLGVGLIAGLIFFWMRKKKQGEELANNEADDEKYWGSDVLAPPSPPPKPEPVTSPNPPQLNVRPVTQFAPFASEFGDGFTSLSTVGEEPAIASSETGTRSLTGNSSPIHTPQSSSASSNPFNDPVDPFNSPSEAPSPSRSVAQSSSVSEESTVSGSAPEVTTATGIVATGVVAGATAAAVAGSSASDKGLPTRPESFTSHASSESDPFSHGPVSPVSPVNANTVPVPTAPTVAAAPLAAPMGPGPAPSNVHRVHMDFVPSMADEMELRAGDLVRLLHEYDDGWALCIRMDRSQQGVVPRSCLSSRPLKLRPGPPPGAAPGPRGPSRMGPNGPMPAGPMTQTPRFYPQDARPQSPACPMSPARPMSPANSGYPAPPQAQPYQRPMSPAQLSQASRSFSPGPGPMIPRSLSPGPYGHPGLQGPHMPASQRMRSNSTGAVNARMAGPVGPSPLGAPMRAMAMHPAAIPAPVSATIETVPSDNVHE